MLKRFALTLFLFVTIGLILNKSVKADGTYYNIGTSTSNNGSPDAVSWSTGNPIVVDSFGNIFAPSQQNGHTTYDLSYSNDKGVTWNVDTTVAIPGRPAVAYDAVNDTLLALSADGNGNVTFRRYIIRRDVDYKINHITLDTSFTALGIDDQGSCSGASAGDPILLIKEIGGVNKVVAFWSVSKTGCGGSDFTATRGAFLNISNDASDGSGASWHSLNGTANAGASGDANINFSQIYVTSGALAFFQHSALIKSTGSNTNAIYYFNINENGIHQSRILPYNSGFWDLASSVPFGGDVNDSQGYNLKRELLSKPVEATGQDKVYVGIARWLDNTNGDTQSLFAVSAGGQVGLAGDVYSAGGTHCIYPTFDIAYDQTQNQVYTFYDISGGASVCGNVYYKTYNGTTFGAATAFYTQANRSVDIPIVYTNRFDDKMQLFFRLNNASNPGLPPHELYYGYVGLNTTATPPSKVANGANNNEDFSYTDFNSVCAQQTGIDIQGGGGIASIDLKSRFLDEFETPRNPYSLVYDDKWDIPETWNPGLFEPKPNGNVNIYTANGAYLISRPSFAAGQSFSFTANFTQKNFEHIGLVDSNGFNQYIIFSTGNDGVLKARVSDGSEVNTVIGTSYYNSFHTYTISWGPSTVSFLIDGISIDVFSTNIPTGNLHLIVSNNDHSAGSDLLIDSIKSSQYQSLSGTYTSCPIDSGIANADWLLATYGATINMGQTIQFQVRTSNDLTTWSGWSSNLNSGANITSPLGRYSQYLVTLTSSSAVSSPDVYDVNLTFVPPTPPDAVNDSASTAFDTAVVVNVLANDVLHTALDGTSPSVTVNAAHGNAVVTDLAGGVVTYTPTAGYSGNDILTYQICDTDTLCDTATVSIIVNPAPTTPDNTDDNSGSGSSAGTIANTCSDSKPGVPTILSGISTDPSKIKLKYQSGTGAFTKFDIEFSKLSQSYKDTDLVKLDKTIFEYIASNLNASTTYFFRIRAENGCNTSDWSTEFKVVTAAKVTDVSTSGEIKRPVSASVDQASEFNPVYLLVICCPLALVLLLILTKRKKKEEKESKDFNQRFK